MSRKNEAPSSRYMGGYVSAVSEYGEHKFDLDEVIYDLQTHPSENEEQQGYLDALLSIRRYGVPVNIVDNIAYVGWQVGKLQGSDTFFYSLANRVEGEQNDLL